MLIEKTKDLYTAYHMTRDFNNQQRDNTRSFSRNQSSFNNRNHGEGQGQNAGRPGRPRLNREIVDRAWESGARQQHADYRPRSGGQPPRGNNQRWNQQDSGRPAYGHSNFQNRPYGSREEGPYSNNRHNDGERSRSFDRDRDQRGNGFNPNHRDSRPSFNRDNGPRGNSFNPNQRFERDNGPRGNSFNPNQRFERDSRPGFQRDNGPRGNSFNPNQRFERDNDQRGNSFNRDSRPPFNRDSRPDFNRDSRPSFNRDSRPGFDRNNDSRGPRNFQRDGRPGFNRDQRGPARPHGNGNPNYQPRPGFNRDGAQFEGDYEHFNRYDERGRSTARPFQGRASHAQPPREQREERHVTRLDDGRVLKGPRPAQRKNAQFWQEISQSTETLVPRPENPASTDEIAVEAENESIEQALPVEVSEQAETETPVKNRPARKSRATTAVSRVKRTEAKKRSTGPKPSQKGFKWPTPDAN